MKRVVLYNRVSTSQFQSTDRQVSDLTELCNNKEWEVIKVFEEVISGYVKKEERVLLNKVISFCKVNDIDMVVVSELSRLGRNTEVVLSYINEMTDNGIGMYIQQFNLHTMDNDGKSNPMSMLMLSVLSSVNQMEKSITLDRMNSGRKNYIKKGGVVGRKKGSIKTTEDKLKQHSDIVEYLNKGYRYDDIKELTKKSLSTIQRVNKLVTH